MSSPNSNSLEFPVGAKSDITTVTVKEDGTSNANLQQQMDSIDAEIAWHYAQIAMRKAKRNAITPISRLPNELLSRIITRYAVDSDELANLKWTKIMKVCWRWHHLGLAAQSLWAFIETDWSMCLEREGLHRRIQRSGVAPLTLTIKDCDSDRYNWIIFEQSARIQNLDISGEAPHIYDLLANVANRDFPILTSLQLDLSIDRDHILGGSIPVLPNGMLGSPRLRTLTLSFIDVPWMSIRGLESLSLTHCNNFGAGSIRGFDALFTMLEACPQLQTLRLENILPAQADFLGNRTMHLPALADLRLRDHISVCQTILNHLEFPPSAVVQIYPTDVHGDDDVREILVRIRQRMDGPGVPVPSLLKVESFVALDEPWAPPPPYLTISTYSKSASPERIDRDAQFLLNSHPDDAESVHQIMVKVILALPCQHITCLDLQSATYSSSRLWMTALELLPSLETAFTRANLGAVHFLKALIEVESLNPLGRLYPRISHLHLVVALWDKDQDLNRVLGLLQTYLQLCRQLGTPLPALEVEIEERRFTRLRYEELLETLLLLEGDKIICNGTVYRPDPVA
ncbi:hypothetical protein DFH06DRAFT_1108931 [Mycena polygramma]|nr:hypothetical protein DFH06DRAFT_1108931 [Mycena polygramma]